MADPFVELQSYLNGITGWGLAVSGFLLGIVVTVVLMVMLIIVLDPKGRDRSGMLFVLSAGLGVIISGFVGDDGSGNHWFPIWVVVIFGFVLIFIVADPLSSKRGD